MMFKFVVGLLATAYAGTREENTAELLNWVKTGYPAQLSDTIALASDADNLLSASVDRDIALILPNNDAWAKHKKDYQNVKSNKALGMSLLLDAAVEVENLSQVKTIKDLKIRENMTMGGTALIVDPKDASRVYFAEYKEDGSLKKTGQGIKIKAKPVAKFSQVLIFEATSFSMPPSVAASL